METETECFRSTRESLVKRLADLDDQTSWRVFYDTYWRLFYKVARRAGFEDAAAEDIVQETFVVVARHMPNFDYDRQRGSFKGWLLQIARTRTIDALRKKHRRQGDEFVPREQPLKTALLKAQPADSDINLIWDEELQSHHLEMAIERVKNRDPRRFQMFDLHVRKGVPAQDVARRLGAKLPEIYFAKYKIAAQLKKEIQRLEKD